MPSYLVAHLAMADGRFPQMGKKGSDLVDLAAAVIRRARAKATEIKHIQSFTGSAED